MARFIDWFLNIISRSGTPAAASAADAPIVVYSPRTGATGTSGGPALAIATVYRCVSLLSNSVANLPIAYKRRDDNGIFREDTGRLWYLLNVEPSPTMSAFDFKRHLVCDILLQGNAYAVLIYDPEEMQWERIELVNPGCVSVNEKTGFYTINDDEAGVHGVYAPTEVLHFKGFGRNRRRGVSVLTYARMTLDIANAGDAETLNRIQNGGDVRGVLGNDTSVQGWGKNQDQQLQFAAEDVDSKFRSGQRIVHLPGSVDFKQLSMSSADMQFLETRRFTVRDICRFFGVHPSYVFDDTSNNYKSAEMANAAFLSNTLDPLLKMIENELLRKFVPQDAAWFRKFEFNRRGLLACDLASDADYKSKLLGMGAVTINELRAMEDMPAVEGGDAPLVSANLKGVGELNASKPNNTDSDEQI